MSKLERIKAIRGKMEELEAKYLALKIQGKIDEAVKVHGALGFARREINKVMRQYKNSKERQKRLIPN